MLTGGGSAQFGSSESSQLNAASQKTMGAMPSQCPSAPSAAAPASGGPVRYQAGTTYGKSLVRWSLATDGLSPEGTAVLVTRDSMASGALSASVRPLRTAKP
jgi:hypothetical protein